VFTLIGAALGAAYVLTATRMYSATTQLFVSAQTGTTAQDLQLGSAFSQAQMPSYASLAKSPIVLGPVAAQQGVAGGLHGLTKHVSVSTITGSVILSITVSATSPNRAATLSNAIGRSFIRVTPTLQQSESNSPVKVTAIQRATPPDAPSSPKTPEDVTLGLLLGLLIGVAWASIVGRLNTRLKTASEVISQTDLPLLGVIPATPAVRANPIALAEGGDPALAEAYRVLRTSLHFAHTEDKVGAVLITSAMPAEGKSLTAVNLALALGEAGQSVVVVDADLHRPSVARYLGYFAAQGLTSVLVGDVSLRDALVWHTEGRAHIGVLSAGPPSPNPSGLLDSQRFDDLLDQLREQFDVVVVDGPPVTLLSDASILAAKADGTILVAGAGVAQPSALSRTLDQLSLVQAHLLGIVVNREPRKRQGGYYGYGTYSDSRNTDKADKAAAKRNSSTKVPGPVAAGQLGKGHNAEQPAADSFGSAPPGRLPIRPRL
jgi:capsular exopolysaccharide synthesis family protein